MKLLRVPIGRHADGQLTEVLRNTGKFFAVALGVRTVVVLHHKSLP
jgi:hypothetical protein